MHALFSQDKGVCYGIEASAGEMIRDMDHFYGLKKWGFVMNRCTCGDDEAWSRFLDRFKRHTTTELQEYSDEAPDLIPSYDLNVQEDPTLERTTRDEVRRRFRQLQKSLLQSEVPGDLEEYKKRQLVCENP